jgi:hypothetical protein
MDIISTSKPALTTNKTSGLETPETDPATESADMDDFDSHTPVRQPGLEAATHPLQPPSNRYQI